MSYHYWEALVFVPQRDITFHGFGIFAHRDDKDVKHKFKYGLEGDISDEVKLELSKD